MIEYGNKKYVLKYNMKRIEMIESVTSMPTLAGLRKTGGMFGLADLRAYIIYGIKEEGSDVFLKPREAAELAERLIEENGYTEVCTIVLEALEEGLPFFLPSRLIEFEYLGEDESDQEYVKIAEPYQKDIDFAFFVVNFGYSKSDYEALTPREIAFIRKAWENKMVTDSYSVYNAAFTAFYNANRPKRKKALKLWKKAKVKRADMETIHENMKVIREVENKEGSSWVDAIYKANGMSLRRGGVRSG